MIIIFFYFISDQAILDIQLNLENMGQVCPMCCGFRPQVCSVGSELYPSGAEAGRSFNGQGKPHATFLFIYN